MIKLKLIRGSGAGWLTVQMFTCKALSIFMLSSLSWCSGMLVLCEQKSCWTWRPARQPSRPLSRSLDMAWGFRKILHKYFPQQSKSTRDVFSWGYFAMSSFFFFFHFLIDVPRIDNLAVQLFFRWMEHEWRSPGHFKQTPKIFCTDQTQQPPPRHTANQSTALCFIVYKQGIKWTGGTD